MKNKRNRKLQQIQSSKTKKPFPVNIVEEELVLQDDFCFEAPETFTTNREKITNVSSDSEGETNSDFSRSPTTNLCKENLKTIPNKQMLTDNVINVLQKIFKMLEKYLHQTATLIIHCQCKLKIKSVSCYTVLSKPSRLLFFQFNNRQGELIAAFFRQSFYNLSYHASKIQ